MRFVHDDPEFSDLLRIVAGRVRLQPGLVEKDYWVAHVLWSMGQCGLDLWFKGGTSLSKGFGLIERFSEDLDLKVEPGALTSVPHVGNWKSVGTTAIAQRGAYFAALEKALVVPGAAVTADPEAADPSDRQRRLRVSYRGRHLADLGPSMKPFVVLEIGDARVTPFVERDLGSFVHDELMRGGRIGDFRDNRPKSVRCVHPLVTLIEKLDAVHRRALRETADPATFVRHFEDAARVIEAETDLPRLDGYADVRALAAEMLSQRQIAEMPSADDPAFALADGARKDTIIRAHAEIGPMFWGRRIGLDAACGLIREWIALRL